MEKYLIVVDLDGTLMLDFKKNERKATRLLKKLNKNNIVMIATGRPMRSSMFMYKKMKLTSPIINYNGALVSNPTDPNFPTTDLRVNKNDIIDILKHIGDDLLNVFSEIHDNIYVLRMDKVIKPYLHTKGGDIHLGNLEEILPDNPNGCIIFVKDGASEKVEKYINDNYSDTLRFRYWGEDQNFHIGEIYSVDTNKGTGVKTTIDYYHIKPENVIVIGDGHNDIEMFQEAAYKVAVSNAHKELIPHANYIADSNTNKGVYKFLKNFFKEK